jgi:hypothetical protein
VAVIAQQGADWGDPIGWIFLLLVLIILGFLVVDMRNEFPPTPALDDDRWGLRRAIDGFFGGRRTLALAVLLLLLAVGVGSAVGGGLPSSADEGPGASGIPSNWAGLEPLLPLVPSLRARSSSTR